MTSPVQGGDPFLQSLGLAAPGDDPFLRSLGVQVPSFDLETARGRAGFEAQGDEERIKKLKELLARPDISPQQRAGIESLIQRWSRGERTGGGYGALSDLGSSISRGVIGASMGLADLAAATTNLLTPGAIAQPIRNRVAEAQAGVRELIPTQKDDALAVAGEIAGGIVGGAPGYGAAARLSAQGIAKVIPASRGILQASTRLGQGGNVVSQALRGSAAGNVLAGLPINVVQAVTLPDATAGERWKQFLINTGADALFGAVIPGAQIKPATPKMAVQPPAPGPTGAEISKELEAKAEAMKVQRRLEKLIKQDAQAKWATENPGILWSEVPKETRADYVKAYKESIASKAKPAQAVVPSAESLAKEVEAKAPRMSQPAALIKVQENDAGGIYAKLAAQWWGNFEAGKFPGIGEPGIGLDIISAGFKFNEKQFKNVADLRQYFREYDLAELTGKDMLEFAHEKIAVPEIPKAKVPLPGSDPMAIFDPAAEGPVSPQAQAAAAKLGSKSEKNVLAAMENNLALLHREHAMVAGSPDEASVVKRIKQMEERINKERAKVEPVAEGDPLLMVRTVEQRLRDPDITPEAKAFWEGELARYKANVGAPKIDFTPTEANLPPELTAPLRPEEMAPGPMDRASLEARRDALNDELDELVDGSPESIAKGEELVAIGKQINALPKAAAPVAAPRVVEPQQVPMFHGSGQSKLNLSDDKPLYLTTDKAMADSYTSNSSIQYNQKTGKWEDLKGKTHKFVLPLDLTLATPEQLKASAAKLGIDTDISTAHLASEPKVIADLEAQGFQGVKDAMDFGFVDTNVEKPVTVIFRPKSVFGGVELPPIDPKLFRAKPSQIPTTVLPRVIEEMELRLASELDPQSQADLSKRINVLTEELASRKPRPPFDVNMPAEIGSAFAGGMAGYNIGGGTEEERWNRAIKYGLLAAGGVAGVKQYRKFQAKMTTEKLESPKDIHIGGQTFRRPSVTREELSRPAPNTSALMRHWYSGIFRGSYGGEVVGQYGNLKDLPTHLNFADRLFHYGRYIPQTETALTDGVYLEDAGGNIQKIFDKGLGSILGEYFGGDKLRFSDVTQALASAEGASVGRPVSMDLPTRTAILNSLSPEEIEGAKQARGWNLAVAKSLHGSKVSDAGLAKMEEEKWFTPMMKVTEKLQSQGIMKKDMLSTPPGIFARKGGNTKVILNTYDAMVESAARIFKAAEDQKIKQSFIDYTEALPKHFRDGLAVRVDKVADSEAWKPSAAAELIRKELTLTEADAKALQGFLDDGSSLKRGVMRVWRDGVLQTYKVNGEAFKAFKSLEPYEVNAALKLLGLPARGLSLGVVHNPWFIAYQSIIDGMTSMIQSKYGLSLADLGTGGYASVIRGWYHAVKRTKQYRELQAFGGPSTIQSLQYTNPRTAAKAAARAGATAGETFVNSVKELKFGEAWKAITLPLAEAARIGEYLRALDHGATTLEAVYAARNVLGNPRMQGAFGLVRGMNHTTPFLRPALAALDKTLEETGLHPLQTPRFGKDKLSQYFKETGVSPRVAAPINLVLKSFAGITVPSLLLWAYERANDDQEVKELRTTETGQRYWFFRSPHSGEIFKVRKPHVLGQVFGTSVEMAADALAENDPIAAKQVIDGLLSDAQVTLLPTFGVIPLALAGGKDPSTGFPIGPMRDARRDPSTVGYAGASQPARIIAGKAADITRGADPDRWYSRMLRTGLSPAGVDFLIRNTTGMLGEDAARILTNAMEWSQEGSPPPLEEWAVLRRTMVKMPSTSIKPVEEFYKRDVRVSRVAATLEFLAKNKPEKVQEYIASNLTELQLVPLHRELRMELAELRRAIDDIRAAPGSMMTMEEKRRIEASINAAIVTKTRSVSEALRTTVRP